MPVLSAIIWNSMDVDDSIMLTITTSRTLYTPTQPSSNKAHQGYDDVKSMLGICCPGTLVV